MFQFKLSFKTENNMLPKELDRLLVSFIKAAVQKYSPDLFEQLYGNNKSVIKKFTFSCHLPGAKFQGDSILLNKNEFTMLFSDADMNESVKFLNAFRTLKFEKYPMNRNSMQLVSIGMQEKREIEDSEIIVKMQSPLIVRRHNINNNTDIYYTYDQDGFCETLKENVEFFLEKSNIPISADGFSITPIKGKKIVRPIFGRNTDGNIGIYKLTGQPELLNILYLAGVGGRRSAGNGKWEIVW